MNWYEQSLLREDIFLLNSFFLLMGGSFEVRQKILVVVSLIDKEMSFTPSHSFYVFFGQIIVAAGEKLTVQ